MGFTTASVSSRATSGSRMKTISSLEPRASAKTKGSGPPSSTAAGRRSWGCQPKSRENRWRCWENASCGGACSPWGQGDRSSSGGEEVKTSAVSQAAVTAFLLASSREVAFFTL